MACSPLGRISILTACPRQVKKYQKKRTYPLPPHPPKCKKKKFWLEFHLNVSVLIISDLRLLCAALCTVERYNQLPFCSVHIGVRLGLGCAGVTGGGYLSIVLLAGNEEGIMLPKPSCDGILRENPWQAIGEARWRFHWQNGWHACNVRLAGLIESRFGSRLVTGRGGKRLLGTRDWRGRGGVITQDLALDVYIIYTLRSARIR